MKKKNILKVAIVATLVLLLVVCLMVISHPWRYVSIKRDADVSKEVFLQQMEKLDEHYNTSNFSEIADKLFSEAQERGYDVYLAPAVMCIETAGGTKTKTQFNYWTNNPYYYTYSSVTYIGFVSTEKSVTWFFNELDKYGDLSYEEFSRNWTHITGYPLPISKVPTEESDASAKKLYETVKWIKSL